MGFLIVSEDGRLRICTRTALAAASHMKRLQEAGTVFKLTNACGEPCDMDEVVAALQYEVTVAPVAI